MSARDDQHSIILVTFGKSPRNETLLIAFALAEVGEGAAQAIWVYWEHLRPAIFVDMSDCCATNRTNFANLATEKISVNLHETTWCVC